MKYCPNCGNMLNDDAKFCGKCGEKMPCKESYNNTERQSNDFSYSYSQAFCNIPSQNTAFDLLCETFGSALFLILTCALSLSTLILLFDTGSGSDILTLSFNLIERSYSEVAGCVEIILIILVIAKILLPIGCIVLTSSGFTRSSAGISAGCTLVSIYTIAMSILFWGIFAYIIVVYLENKVFKYIGDMPGELAFILMLIPVVLALLGAAYSKLTAIMSSAKNSMLSGIPVKNVGVYVVTIFFALDALLLYLYGKTEAPMSFEFILSLAIYALSAIVLLVYKSKATLK